MSIQIHLHSHIRTIFIFTLHLVCPRVLPQHSRKYHNVILHFFQPEYSRLIHQNTLRRHLVPIYFTSAWQSEVDFNHCMMFSKYIIIFIFYPRNKLGSLLRVVLFSALNVLTSSDPLILLPLSTISATYYPGSVSWFSQMELNFFSLVT